MVSFRDRMKSKKDALRQRHNSNATPGGRFPTIYLKSNIPPGVNFFRDKEGSHIIDILPWEVGTNMPLDETGSPVTDKGDFDYVLDLAVHQNVGKGGVPFVCPYVNFNKPCPICEYLNGPEKLPKDQWSKIRAKRRSIYLIWNRTSPEEEKKGVQIYDVAYFFMEEKLKEIATLPKGGGKIFFSDPDEGKSVCWTRKGTGIENTQYIGHRFLDRESGIPDSILEKTFSLDSVINMHPTYEEISIAWESGTKGLKVAQEPVKQEKEESPFEDVEDIPDSPKKEEASENVEPPPVKRVAKVFRKK